MNHINIAFPEEKRPMMYKMMKWWGGKPHNIWSEYIERYSKKGDIVLDPFCGRGVGVIESVKNGRKAIGIDLNPIAIFQTKMILKKLDVEKFKKEWGKIKTDLRQFEETSDFFTTECVQCKNNARLITMNREHDVPYTLFYRCTCTRGYQEKHPDDEDLEKIINSNAQDVEAPYPNIQFPETHTFDLARRNYGDTYEGLFSTRNLYALSLIFQRINQVENNDFKEFFRYAFVSMVHLVSKIPSVRENSNRVASGSWGRPGYLKLRKYMELNPFLQYERAIEGNQGILKGKISSNNRLKGKVKFANSVNELSGDRNILLLQKNTLEISSFLEENSVDYVITDPPYGGLIPYFDLSFIWSAWLSLDDENFTMPFSDEITIDERRNINFDEYHRRLDIAFDQIYKVLKEGKYMTVTFHNDQPKIFNSILSACQDSGFVLEKILFQMNRRAGETGAATPWGTSVSDFYIRFKKPKQDEKTSKLTDFIDNKFENIVERVAKEVISERGEPTEIAAMIPHIYSDMGKSGMKILFSSDDQISTILDKNKNFVKKENGMWWLVDDIIKKSKLSIPLSDRVEESVLSKLRQSYTVTYDEILQNIFETFPNSLTPNTENVKEHLSEYGEKTRDGRWKLKLGMSESEVTSKHTDMETILAKIGTTLEYDIWSPDKSKNPELNELCIDFNLDIPNSDRIKLIDVLWIKENVIQYAFEVENSTGITSALERGSHINSKDVKRIIILPNSRKQFFERKMREPIFSDYFKKDSWKVALYDELETFVKDTSQNKDSFTKLLKESV